GPVRAGGPVLQTFPDDAARCRGALARPRTPPQVAQDLARGVASRQPGDAAAGMGPGPAQVQAGQRAAIAPLPQQRAGAEHLVEAERAVADVAADQAELALEVERRERAVAEHAAREVRRHR